MLSFKLLFARSKFTRWIKLQRLTVIFPIRSLSLAMKRCSYYKCPFNAFWDTYNFIIIGIDLLGILRLPCKWFPDRFNLNNSALFFHNKDGISPVILLSANTNLFNEYWVTNHWGIWLPNLHEVTAKPSNWNWGIQDVLILSTQYDRNMHFNSKRLWNRVSEMVMWESQRILTELGIASCEEVICSWNENWRA